MLAQQRTEFSNEVNRVFSPGLLQQSLQEGRLHQQFEVLFFRLMEMLFVTLKEEQKKGQLVVSEFILLIWHRQLSLLLELH